MTLKEHGLVVGLTLGQIVMYDISKSEENSYVSVLEEKNRIEIPGENIIPKYIIVSQSEATSIVITNVTNSLFDLSQTRQLFEMVVSVSNEVVSTLFFYLIFKDCTNY